MKRINANEKNGMWKGDKVSYKGLHTWVGRNFKKLGVCQRCKEEIRTDWANISGNYLRDRIDWTELCRKCHMTSDSRLEKLKERNHQALQTGWINRKRDNYGRFISGWITH